MKVAFIGNQDNNAYRLCKWIRNMGIKAHLYMLPLIPANDSRSFPELIDPEIRNLSGDYPCWIHNHGSKKNYWYLTDRSFAKQLENNYDIIVTSGLSGLLAANLFSCIPVVHMSLGSEVTEIPFLLFKKVNFQKRLISFFLRRALKKVYIILSAFIPTIKSVQILKLEKKLKLWGFPEEVSQDMSRIDKSLFDNLTTLYDNYYRVFLWLSRINYLDKTSSAYKGPERFLEAFEKIVWEHSHRIKLVVGEHGADINHFKRMINNKGLDRFVDFVPHLPYQKLLTYLSLPNGVVFDELDKDKGELSGVAREALSVGTVVVKTIDSKLIEMCFGPDCPVINAFDVPSCYFAMKDIIDCDNEKFEKLRKKSMTWASRYLHYEHNTSKLIDLFKEIIFCHRLAIK